MKLGIVTYNIAAEWSCDTLLTKCEELGYEGVELRTTHAHGVEVSLTAKQRHEVQLKFADSPVELVGLGSTFEYHSADADELRRNIDGSKEAILLAKDVGAEGIKVRPNAFPEDVEREKTIEQIGVSLKEVGDFANAHGVKVRLEVHGRGTCDPKVIREIMDIADHPDVHACWNSNMTDLDENGSIDGNFELLKEKIEICHINQLWNDYPWQRLFSLLQAEGYNGFCLAEIPGSQDADTVLRYYRKLFKIACGTPA